MSGATPPPPSSPPPKRQRRLVRWEGLIPLALVLVLIGIGWVLFSDPIIRDSGEEALTKLLGTQVDIGSVELREQSATLIARDVEIADPFDPMRNLLQARRLRFILEPEPLLEKKIIISELSIEGVRLGVARRTAATPAPIDGYAARTVKALRDWRQQFEVPLLNLTPIDTIRSIALDPTQLTTVRQAQTLAARADSLRTSLQEGYAALRLRETLDTAQAVATSLADARPLPLGIDGTRRAIADVRRTIAVIDSARGRVRALERQTREGVEMMRTGVRTLDDARRADYAFARGLLELPSFEGPALGGAMFGDVSLDRFQQVVYWAELAEEYLPPGLRPRAARGPERLRASGTSVRYPKEREYPSFLMRTANLSILGGADSAAGSYSARVLNLTSAPELVGQPTLFAARRTAQAGPVRSLRVVGALNHTGTVARDSVAAFAEGVSLPSFDIPSLPFRVEPGRGTSELRVRRVGEMIDARWSFSASQVAWRSDSARARSLNDLERLVFRVVSGVRQLDVTAEMTGPIRTPSFRVRSNLDRALGEQLRAVAGEELARAEAKVRAEVDRIVEERTAPVRARLAEIQTEAESRVEEAKARLDAERERLDERLKALGAGVIPFPR